MGWRFRKSIKIAPGVRLNLSNLSPSLSVGPRGASVSIGKRGVYGNVGIPGTGLSYRERLDRPATRNPSRSPAPSMPPAPLPPPVVNIRIRKDVVEFLDEQQNPVPASEIPLIKAVYRDQLLDLLSKRVDELNDNQRQSIGDLHLDTPPPAPAVVVPVERSPYPVPKPERPTDSAGLPAFMERLSAWRVEKAEYEATSAGGPDLQAIAQPILDRLSALSWPRETSVELDLSEDGRELLLNVDLPEIDDMPTEEWRLDKGSVEIVRKPLSQTAIAQLYARHVHGIVLRMVGEAFAAQGAIETVQFDGYSQRLSGSTGHIKDTYILSVRIHRRDWETLNFGNLGAVDPVAGVARYELRREMKARGDLREITPFRA